MGYLYHQHMQDKYLSREGKKEKWIRTDPNHLERLDIFGGRGDGTTRLQNARLEGTTGQDRIEPETSLP